MNELLDKVRHERHELLLSQRQITERLLALDQEEHEILTMSVRNDENQSVSLKFGKDVITWGNSGKALAIRGDGYRILKALYVADKNYLTREELEEIVWDKKKLLVEDDEARFVKQNTFRKAISRLAEKLELAKFPYRITKVESDTQYEPTGKKFKSGKQKVKPIQPEIIGVRLGGTVNCPNVPLDR